MTVTSVTLPSDSSMTLLDWFVDQGNRSGQFGVGGPWKKPTGPAVDVATGSAGIALLLKSKNPKVSSVVTSGVIVKYRTKDGTGKLTVGTDMGFVPHGQTCGRDLR
ncbi:hypothetical protein GCM10027579_28520 [Calidifontibacter terrae]